MIQILSRHRWALRAISLALQATNRPMVIQMGACGLPSGGRGSKFVIAKEDFYFVYPTNFNEYQRQYKDSFQHGGISLEEMILPVAIMEPK